MTEYIVISVPDEKDIACFNCERDTCVEVGCKHAPSVFTARPKERIVRCMDCKHFSPTWNECDRMGYEQDGVCPDGYCAWGEPKEGE